MCEGHVERAPRAAVRVPLRLVVLWAAITIGQIAVWSIGAMLEPEPTRTFAFNFIESNVPFLAKLAIGGAVLSTGVWEVSELAE